MRRRTALVAGTAMIAGMVAVGVSWWYFDWGHSPVEKLPRLHGKPLAAVIAYLGEPDRQLDFRMADSPDGEFKVGLWVEGILGSMGICRARVGTARGERRYPSLAAIPADAHKQNGAHGISAS